MSVGVFFGLAAAVSWAIANISIKPCTERYGSWGSLIWTQVLGGVVVLIMAYLIDGIPDSLSASDMFTLLIGGLAAIAAYGGLFESLKTGQVTIVIPIVATWAVISVLTAVYRYNEPLTWGLSAGTVLVVLCNIVLARSAHESGPDSTPTSALLFAALSALGFGVLAPIVNQLGETVGGWWAIPLIWGVELIFIVPLFLFWQLRRQAPSIWPNNLSEFSLAFKVSAFETIGFVAMSIGMTVAPVGIVTPVSSLATGMTVILGVFMLKKVNPRIIMGAIGASLGVVLVSLQ